jgi:hypothetical protein
MGDASGRVTHFHRRWIRRELVGGSYTRRAGHARPAATGQIHTNIRVAFGFGEKAFSKVQMPLTIDAWDGQCLAASRRKRRDAGRDALARKPNLAIAVL